MKKRINFIMAKNIADRYVELLKPFCDKIQIAGSVRRRCSRVGDIEIVCIPMETEISNGLFDKKMIRVKGFAKVLSDAGAEILKGDPGTGKYTQFMLKEKVQLDLFMAGHDNWGFIYMIRTGSSEFSQFMGKRWRKWGYKGVEGHLHRLDANGNPVEKMPTPTEKSVFDLLGMGVVPPSKRNQMGLPR